MNASLWGAAFLSALSCLPRSDDLGGYSAEWSASDDAEDGGTAGTRGAAGGASGADTSSAGSDAVVTGGSGSIAGAGGATTSPAGSSGEVSAEGGAASTADDPAERCPDGVVSDDESRCYIISSAPAAWRDARDECVALQATLVKIETAEEDAFVDTLLAVNLWLGASDTVTENVFVWEDGSAIEFGNWGPAQPDRFPGPDCVEKRDTVARQWFDQPCDNPRAFVCERPIER